MLHEPPASADAPLLAILLDLPTLLFGGVG